MMGMSIPNGTGVRNYSASSSSSSTPSPSVWVPKTQYVPDPDLKKYQNTSSSQSSSSTTLLVNGTINGNRINLQFTAQPASQSTISYVPSQPTVTVPTPAETAIMRGSLYQQFSGGNLSNYFTPYTPPYTHLHVMSSQDSSANYAFPPTGPC